MTNIEFIIKIHSFECYNRSVFKMFLRKERKTGQESQQDFTDIIINNWNNVWESIFEALKIFNT